MRQFTILITTLIFSATTCNAQFWRGFAKATTKAATNTAKVLNKYKTSAISGIVISSTHLTNQKDMQLQSRNARMSHQSLQRVGALPTVTVTKEKPIKGVLPCLTVLVRDTMGLYGDSLAVLSIDAVRGQVEESATIRTD